MRLVRFYLFICVCSLYWTSCGPGKIDAADSRLVPQKGFPTDIIDSLTNYLAYLPNGSQVACVRIIDSVPYFYGVVRENDQLQTISNAQAIYEIGSISKLMTATCLAAQVLKGRIQLDQRINSFLPFPIKDDTPITFLQLANHSSGLPRVPDDMVQDIIFNRSNPYKHYDTTRLRKFLSQKLVLQSRPGEKFGYSNLGFGLLGYTLEQITEDTYEQQLQEQVFQVYGMVQSTTNRSQVQSNLVPGLNARGRPCPNWDFSALPGAGAVLSSSHDLASFLLGHFNRQDALLSRTRQMTYQRGSVGGIGLGWFIRQDANRRLFWHNGGTGGYKAFLMMDPLSRDGVIVLSNCSAFSEQSPKIDALGQSLLPNPSN